MKGDAQPWLGEAQPEASRAIRFEKARSAPSRAIRFEKARSLPSRADMEVRRA